MLRLDPRSIQIISIYTCIWLFDVITDLILTCCVNFKTLRVLPTPQFIKVKFSQYDSAFLCLDLILCSLCKYNESRLQYKPPAVKLRWDRVYSLPPTSVSKTLINSSSTACLGDFNVFYTDYFYSLCCVIAKSRTWCMFGFWIIFILITHSLGV